MSCEKHHSCARFLEKVTGMTARYAEAGATLDRARSCATSRVVHGQRGEAGTTAKAVRQVKAVTKVDVCKEDTFGCRETAGTAEVHAQVRGSCAPAKGWDQ